MDGNEPLGLLTPAPDTLFLRCTSTHTFTKPNIRMNSNDHSFSQSMMVNDPAPTSASMDNWWLNQCDEISSRNGDSLLEMMRRSMCHTTTPSTFSRQATTVVPFSDDDSFNSNGWSWSAEEEEKLFTTTSRRGHNHPRTQSVGDLVGLALSHVDSEIASDLLQIEAPVNSNKRSVEEDDVAPKRRRVLEDSNTRFRPYQQEQWDARYEQLLTFKKTCGHCCVPHTFEENPTLSRWVKRQRYQYRLRQEEKDSSMTADRVQKLEEVGFVWDSHAAAWQERLSELKQFLEQNGHSSVPSNNPQNPQLATWVKCQRRQYKLFCRGKTSNMTAERIFALNELGFMWDMRRNC